MKTSSEHSNYCYLAKFQVTTSWEILFWIIIACYQDKTQWFLAIDSDIQSSCLLLCSYLLIIVF